MNSGLVSTVTLTAPHKQIPVTRLSSAPVSFAVSIVPRGMASVFADIGRMVGGKLSRPPSGLPPGHSWAPAPTATQARSALDTDSSLNVRAAAAIRVSACASGIGGLVSPFLTLWKRTGLIRATT
jgi:hypothetical protein